LDGRNLTIQQFRDLQEKFTLWKMQNPKRSSSDELQALMRLYEIHNYGITSKDLALGKTVDWVQQDGQYHRVEAAVSGIFYCDPNQRGSLPQCHFNRASFKMSKDGQRMSYKQYIRDAQLVKEERLEKLEDIKLATAHDTGVDTGSGKSLMESALDTGFGSSSGVVRPVFMNMLLELVSLKAFMKNFVNIEAMDSMSFYYPMKTSAVQDHAAMHRATGLPTAEGRAGMDYGIEYDRYEINGWKYLRHAELTDEVNELVGKFLNVQSHYVEDLSEGMALLWDWPIVEGIQDMMVKGMWRRPKKGAPITWIKTDEIPFGKASVLTTNAKSSNLFQDQSGSTNDGKIYEPSVTTTEEFDYHNSTARAGTSGADELYEGVIALATLLKKKRSKIEYIILTDSRMTERMFKDSRFLDARLQTGNPRFQDETGFIGRISIGGSSSQTDIWEAPEGLFNVRATDDDTPTEVLPIIAGRYGRGWTHGVFTPASMRVDKGFEVVTDAGVGDSEVLRDNETTVITTSSKGSSWPGDYHDFAILWQCFAITHS
jgi:hypothetical protein